MKDIIGEILTGKVFGRVREYVDEITTTKEKKEELKFQLHGLESRHEEVMAKRLCE